METNKRLNQFIQKRQKGQVLVILALTFIGLIAVIGLAVDLGYMYVSYANLRRGVDGAALSATTQFKRGSNAVELQKSASEFLNLNGATNLSAVSIENCFFSYDGTNMTTYAEPAGSGDPALCTTPPRKLIRVTASENVPTFFISVLGIRYLPITVSSISEAASVDIVLTIDRSESMAWYKPDGTKYPFGDLNRDPKNCNTVPNSCHPFKDILDAADSFVNSFMYEPYDQAAVVTFDHDAQTNLDLIGDTTTITNTINGLTVYDGQGNCADGTYWPPFGFYKDPTTGNPDGVWPEPYVGHANAPCRLYEYETWDPAAQAFGGAKLAYYGLGCASGYNQDGETPDYSACQSTNTAAGLALAQQELYNHGRSQALWVTILLTDGVPNEAFNASGTPICPEKANPGDPSGQIFCQDATPLTRHCYSTSPDPVLDSDCLAGWGTTNLVDDSLFDADDYARRQIDALHANGNTVIFAIGVGPEVTSTTTTNNPGTPVGESFLNYAAHVGGTDTYYQSDINSSSTANLQKIFADIASRIGTRLTK